MSRSSVTISLVPEVRGGPFIFWDDLAGSIRQAADLGFDGVEVFADGATALDAGELLFQLREHKMALAALGTGAGWVKRKLSLTGPDPATRRRAEEFIGGVIESAGQLNAPAIIGSMQGRWNDEVDRPTALGFLRDALNRLGEQARRFGVPLLYEPLNRYETNLLTTIADGVEFLQTLSTHNVKLLADLFHMNIEEANIADALRAGKGHIGHVHFVDSNRRPAGRGHIDYAPIAAALRETDYAGFLSAEAFAYPDPFEAAKQTIATYHKYFG